MVTGKLHNGSSETLGHCGCTTITYVLSPGASTGQYNSGWCGQKRGKVEPVTADSLEGVLEECVSVGGTLLLRRREVDARLPVLVAHAALCCEELECRQPTLTMIDI